MDVKYLQNKPYEMKVAIWTIMEERQEDYPYEHFGWYGFIIFCHNGNI